MYVKAQIKDVTYAANAATGMKFCTTETKLKLKKFSECGKNIILKVPWQHLPNHF